MKKIAISRLTKNQLGQVGEEEGVKVQLAMSVQARRDQMDHIYQPNIVLRLL